MHELSISVPLVLGGTSVSGEVFLERTATQAISRAGARILSRQPLAPGDGVKLLLPEQDQQLAARVTAAGPRKGEQQEFLLGLEPVALPFWSLLYLAAQCVAPASPAKPAAEATESAATDRLSEMIRETAEEALDRRLDHVLDDLEKRYPPAAVPTPDTEARLSAFETRLGETMERMWQELGRRFNTAGVAYEKHMDEVAQARAAEFETRLTASLEERLAAAIKTAADDFQERASFIAEKLQQRR